VKYFQLGKIEVHCTDVVDWAVDYKQGIEAGKVKPLSAILCDPPYGLGDPPPIEDLLRAWLGGKDFDTGKGFMSTAWDVVPPPHVWRAFLEISYPGAWLFAFGGTRTVDLLSVSLRIAGWIKRDEITHFLHGQGFPKSLSVGKALDKEAGMEREAVGINQDSANRTAGGMFVGENEGQRPITAPATPLAQLFDGYGTALKPSVEPVVIFQAPRQGHTFAQLAREFGTGALNVGASRVTMTMGDKKSQGGQMQDGTPRIQRACYGKFAGNIAQKQSIGRFPPNAVFSHVAPRPCPTCHTTGVLSTESLGLSGDVPESVTCPTCAGVGWTGGCVRAGEKMVKCSSAPSDTGSETTTNVYQGGYQQRSLITHADPDGLETVPDWRCVEGCAVKLLGEQSGERPSSARPNAAGKLYGRKDSIAFQGESITEHNSLHSDKGTAARFFHNFDWQLDILEPPEISPFFYTAKASRGERDAGCDSLEPSQPPKHIMNRLRCATCGGWQHTGSAIAANRPDSTCFCDEPDFEPQTGRVQDIRNIHPTVKPLALCKYLAAPLKPPDEFEPTLACPFSGSGSEIIGAMLAGWQNIIGVEREPEYHVISKARIKWWHRWQRNTAQDDPAKIRKLAKKAEQAKRGAQAEGQLTMFDQLEESAK
jgi:hypothetical protein